MLRLGLLLLELLLVDEFSDSAGDELLLVDEFFLMTGS